MYCPLCCLLEGHDNKHELIYINVEKIRENKDKLYEESVSEFDKIYKKAKKLKERIDEENKKIRISYEEVENNLTTFYKNEHLNLDIQEKKVKNELDEKVKEIKNELQKFIKEIENIVSSCEKIDSLIEDYKENSYNSEIKTLHYISKIILNNEKSNEFFKKPIKNVNITFPPDSLYSEKDTPRYYYYIFNGIPVPKIDYLYKKTENIKIRWNIDSLKFEYNKIEYLVEIKEEGNGDWSSFTVDEERLEFKYKNDTNYEVKIRVIVDGLYGEYSEIKKFNEKDL